jgi:hypothetical protein
MVEKEIRQHACPHNALRMLILQSAMEHQSELGRIRFKGALDVLRECLL